MNKSKGVFSMARKLGRQIGQYSRYAIISPVFTILCVILEILIPYLTASIIDKGIAVGDMGHVVKTGLLMLVMALLSALTISPQLAMVYLCVIPIMAVALILLTPVVFKIFDKGFKMIDRLNTIVQENIHGMRVVKSFVRQEKEVEKFQDVSSDLARQFSRAEKILALNSPIMMFCVYACMLVISWFGAQMVVASGNNELYGLTTGDLSAMFTYTTQILSALMMNVCGTLAT